MVAQEQQSFRGTLIMYGIILLELPTLSLISVLYFTGKLGEEGWIPMLVGYTLIPLTFLLLMSITLETRLDTRVFSYRILPFQRSWKKLPLEQISSISIHKKDGILDNGGVGLRFLGKTKAFIFFADHVIEVAHGGKKLVFSTEKPKDFDVVINTWQTSNS